MKTLVSHSLDSITLLRRLSEVERSALARRCAEHGYRLAERLPIYPEYAERPEFTAPEMRTAIDAWRLRLERGIAAAEPRA